MNYYLTLDYFRYRYDKMKSYWNKTFNMLKTDTGTGTGTDAECTLININKTTYDLEQKYVSYDELWELRLENTLYLNL
jgi:hypothetical protein